MLSFALSVRIVKKFLRENGQISDEKMKEFNYAQQYYREHREELKEKKREYRQRKKKEIENRKYA